MLGIQSSHSFCGLSWSTKIVLSLAGGSFGSFGVEKAIPPVISDLSDYRFISTPLNRVG